jgi:hypothetical protein
MASRNRPRHYDDAMLAALEKALADVWQVLKAHGPYPDWNPDPELKKELAENLMALADSGISDPQELRNRTLQSLSLGRSN